MKIRVVTSNPHKAEEIAAFFRGIAEITHVPIECPEHRDDDVGEIARRKAEFAWQIIEEPLLVDDTAFCIRALNGFPGPYAAYVLKTLGNPGILKLLEGEPDRTAYFETAVAYADQAGIRVFRGRIDGRVVPGRGTGGFGYDPIFEWEGRTLAELPLDEKSRISHRARALFALRHWLEASGTG
ncbi:MAG: RdgB/HAM1 family non-canonical purine NTP pyrophosphatase [Methanolinea sp.]|nr:RdgB/HAM1 family non-canonical purine NTP pyrophosphatase [Methanolinea sp.]